jgi:hypothetical protein
MDRSFKLKLFHMLRAAEEAGLSPGITSAFRDAWTKSEAFRAAHSGAGENKPLYLDHPQFEGFEVRQTIGRGKTR